MKKILRYFLVFTALAVILTACGKDWLDVNKNPDQPEKVPAKSVFPAAVMSIGYVAGYNFNLIGGFWSQYWTQSNSANQYKSLDSYTLTNSDYNAGWSEMYSGGLNDMKYVVNAAETAKDWNYFLMGTVMQCYAYQMLVDLYGTIPYTDALKGDDASQNTQPKFDAADAIYDNLIVKLDAALAKDFTALTCTNPGTSDYLFGGNITNWKKLANTLKLKIYMRQMYVRPTVAQAGVQKLYTDGALFLTSDAQITQFVDETGKDNPFYNLNVRTINVATNLRASTTMFKYLVTNGDPRRAKFYDSKVNSLPQGGYNLPNTGVTTTTGISVFIQTATDPLVFFSAAESYFLQAEAVAKGWGTGNDQTLYNSGVAASFTKSGSTAAVAATFTGTTGIYAYPTAGTFEQKQEAIIVQKWISMAGSQGIEAFFETNRTHYPAISTIAATNALYTGGKLTYSLEGTAGGTFPKRMLIPNVERTRNANTPAEISLFTKVWWDVKP